MTDPRLIRRLPWSGFANARESINLLRFGWHAVVCSLGLVILPGIYAVRIVRRRRWSIRTLLMLPAMAIVVVTMLTVRWDLPYSESTPPIERMLLGLMLAPAFAFVRMIARRMAAGRWPSVFTWAAVLVASSVVAAIFLPTGDVTGRSSLWEAPLEQGESLSLQGWYVTLLPGTILASWLFLAAISLSWARSHVKHAARRISVQH